MTLAPLELDLDVFAGPFDLLLALILREELDLLEVELAEVVLAYLDHLEAREELDLEAATEFLVLIAALLELKSRLMLPGEEVEALDDLEPAEAAEELLERMLAYARFRGAGGFLRARGEAEQAVLYRAAPLPPALRRAPLEDAGQAYDPDVLGAALGGLLRTPPPLDLRHLAAPRVALAERVAVLRALLRRGTFSFDDAVGGADRMTVAVTLFALLELYKGGEADWEQARAVRADHRAGRPRRGGRVVSLARDVEALLFLAPDPVPVGRARRRAPSRRGRRDRGAGRAGAPRSTAAASSCASWPGAGRSPPTPTPRSRPGACSAGRARRPSPRPRPRRWRSWPTCSRSRARRWRASAASARSRRRWR